MTNSIVKGKNFERETAAYLSRITGSPWNRVPNSGGLASASNKDYNTFQGDLYSPQHKDLVIECKHWRFLTISDLFNTKSEFHKAIRQAIRESEGKEWLLFIKANNQGTLLIHKLFMEPETHTLLQKLEMENFMTLTTGKISETYKIIKVNTCKKQ